jgi:hypothetical protein
VQLLRSAEGDVTVVAAAEFPPARHGAGAASTHPEH